MARKQYQWKIAIPIELQEAAMEIRAKKGFRSSNQLAQVAIEEYLRNNGVDVDTYMQKTSEKLTSAEIRLLKGLLAKAENSATWIRTIDQNRSRIEHSEIVPLWVLSFEKDSGSWIRAFDHSALYNRIEAMA